MDAATQQLLEMAARGMTAPGGAGGAGGRAMVEARRATQREMAMNNFMAPMQQMADFFEFDPVGQTIMQMINTPAALARSYGRGVVGAPDSMGPLREVYPQGPLTAASPEPQFSALLADVGAPQIIQQAAQIIGEMVFDPSPLGEAKLLGMLPDLLRAAQNGSDVAISLLSNAAGISEELGAKIVASAMALGIPLRKRPLGAAASADDLPINVRPVSEIPESYTGTIPRGTGPASGGRFDAGPRGEDIWAAEIVGYEQRKDSKVYDILINEPRDQQGFLIDRDGNRVLDQAGQPIVAQDNVKMKDARGANVAAYRTKTGMQIGPTMQVPVQTFNPAMNADLLQANDYFKTPDVEGLAQMAQDFGGFTVDPRTNVSAPGGVAVSVRPLSTEFRVPLSEARANPGVLMDWFQQVKSDLGYEGRYIGGWVTDEGELVLDVSATPSMDVAMDAARYTDQQAVFDIDNGELVTIGPAVDSLSPGTSALIRGNYDLLPVRAQAKARAYRERVANIERSLRTRFSRSRKAMDRLVEAVERGAAINQGRDWYDIGAIREKVLEAYGGDEEATESWIRAMALFTAVTSPNTPVDTNTRRALELMNLAFSGRDNIDELTDLLASSPGLVTQIFGDALGGTLRNRDGIRAALEEGTLGNGQKISTFFANFLGNTAGVTIDTHNLAGILYAAGMDYTTRAGRREIASLLGYSQPPPKLRGEYGSDWASVPPKQFRTWMYDRVSQNAEYGAFESIQRELAEKLGMTPREFQANLWVGLGDYTGVRSTEPFADIMMRNLERVANERGISIEQVIRAVGNGSLMMIGGVIPIGVYNEMMNRQPYSQDEGMPEEAMQ